MSAKKNDDENPEAINELKNKGLVSKRHFAKWEDALIREHWQTSTDEELAKKIGRDALAVMKRRKRLGLSKPNGRPTNITRKDAVFANPTEYSLSSLSKEDRIKFYKSTFEANFRYVYLKKTLNDDELDYYKRKYVEVLDSIDSITIQEEDLLHNMIMTEIQIMRIQIQIKDCMDQYDDNDDEDKRPPPQYLYKDLNEMEKRYVDYQEKLNLTREQRLKAHREEKVNIQTIIRGLLDRKNKEEAGRTAGVMSYFATRAKDDMNKMKYLLGE